MSLKKIKIGLAQINNSFSGQNYLPYSVGLLQAYAEKYLSTPDKYEFLNPVYLREDVLVTVAKLKDADVVFFSAYVWNIQQCLAIAKVLKKQKPEIVTIFGGPQVPDRVEPFLKQHPFIDACVHGEGEQTFLAILESDVLGHAKAKDWSELASVSFVNKKGEVIKNPPRPRIAEINQVPSPCLSGVFDRLMAANPNEKWIFLWETNRGCPFSCAYCDWGSATQSKVFKFDIERLHKEVDWLASKKIEFVFCADANFGMLPRDLDLVAYVAESKRRTGFPHALSVQNTKNATERAYKVQKLLSDEGLNKGVTLALQSIDPDTLKNIKRANISSESYQELQRRFTRDKVDTYTDIILGLPGETYESFIKGVSMVVENGQHNRIQFNNLSILPNAAMGDPAYQKEHGLVMVETPVVNIHGSLNGANEILETQILVVGTKTCPPEEWIKVRAFSWMSQILYFNKVLQIPLLILSQKYHLPFSDLIEVFLNAPLDRAPACDQIRKFFMDKAKDIQAGGCEYSSSEKYLNIWWPPDELILIELCVQGKLDAFYSEAKTILGDYLKRKSIDVPAGILDDAIKLNQGLMKLPFQTSDLRLELKYNIWEVYQAGRAGVDVPLEQKSSVYEIDRTTQTWNTIDDWCREVVWWGNKKGAYMYSAGALEAQLDGHF